MKLLFDQNLSRKLVNRLVDIFPESSHVQFHNLAEKTDTSKGGHGYCFNDMSKKLIELVTNEFLSLSIKDLVM